jgi:hypothetical protein
MSTFFNADVPGVPQWHTAAGPFLELLVYHKGVCLTKVSTQEH